VPAPVRPSSSSPLPPRPAAAAPPAVAPAVPPVVLRSIVVVAVALVLARLMVAEPLSSANDRSRWCTVYSLAHEGTYQIDRIRQTPGWDTIDLVRKDGHFYSSKPPILAWITAQLYLVQLRAASLLKLTPWTFGTHLEWVTRLLLLVINVIPMAVAWTLVARWCGRFAATPLAAVVALLTFTVGSLLTPFLTTFNNHTVGAAAVVFTLAAALPILLDQKREGWRFFLAGLMAAWTICNELPALAFAGLLFLWLLRLAPRQTLTWGIAGALLPVALYFWTNYEATGSWKPFYASYGKELYVFTHEGVPSYWSNPRGLDTNRDSWRMYLLHCTVGHHGWFSLTPIFLFCLLAWFPGGLRAHPLRGLIRLGGIVSAVVFAFYMAQPEHYNYGGNSQALRWMLWVIPLWILALLPALDMFAQARWSRGPVLLALAISVFSAWYPARGPWGAPWLYTLMDRWGWIDYRDPRPTLPRKVTTWIQSLPESPQRDPDYWIELARTGGDGFRSTLRLEDAGPLPGGPADPGRTLRSIIVTWDGGTQTEARRTLVMDSAALQGGLPVGNVLASAPSPEDLVFLQGLPEPRYYFPSSIQFVKTPVRRDAFRALTIYSSCRVDTESAARNHIRDVWTSDELPFGVVQSQTRVEESGAPQPISRERWTVRAAGKLLTPAPSP
jgi:hypothetical protein